MMTTVLFFLVSCLTGLILGITQKGITINIIHKNDVDKPKEFNQSLAPLLPNEVQEYYKSTNGQNLY